MAVVMVHNIRAERAKLQKTESLSLVAEGNKPSEGRLAESSHNAQCNADQQEWPEEL